MIGKRKGKNWVCGGQSLWNRDMDTRYDSHWDMETLSRTPIGRALGNSTTEGATAGPLLLITRQQGCDLILSFQTKKKVVDFTKTFLLHNSETLLRLRKCWAQFYAQILAPKACFARLFSNPWSTWCWLLLGFLSQGHQDANLKSTNNEYLW